MGKAEESKPAPEENAKDDSDPRIDFLKNYTCHSLQIKLDKFQRMMRSEEYFQVILSFCDHTDNSEILILYLDLSDALAASVIFPSTSKHKVVYFINICKEPLPSADLHKVLMFGDLFINTLQNISATMGDFIPPILTASLTSQMCPKIVREDIQEHLLELNSSIQRAMGSASGKTTLAMPASAAEISELAHVLEQGAGDIDHRLKKRIETEVGNWSDQVRRVLLQDSVTKLDDTPTSGPRDEFDFWSQRVEKLMHVYKQLTTEQGKCIANILERTRSVYFSDFCEMFTSLVAALAEAKSVSADLKHLQVHVESIESGDLLDVDVNFRPLMHVVCLIWANSSYYCTPRRAVILFRRLCNMIIEVTRTFLDPSTLFQANPEDARPNVLSAIGVMRFFKNVYREYSKKVHLFFPEGVEPRLWNFKSEEIFVRFDKFFERLECIKHLFDTFLELMKLEEVAVGGIKGIELSEDIAGCFQDFKELYSTFASRTYDGLDPDNSHFEDDFNHFEARVLDIDRYLATRIGLAFDNCIDTAAMFRMIFLFGSLLDRKIIRQTIEVKYKRLLEMMHKLIDEARKDFEKQVQLNKEQRGAIEMLMPPVSGSLRWFLNLREYVNEYVSDYKSVKFPRSETKCYEFFQKKLENLMERISAEEDIIFNQWTATVPQKINSTISLPILRRTEELIHPNFAPVLVEMLQEVKYLLMLKKEGIPQEAMSLYQQDGKLYEIRVTLENICSAYNNLKSNAQPVEYKLIEPYVLELDVLLTLATTDLNWNSHRISDYIADIKSHVTDLSCRVTKSQENLNKIPELFEPFATKPLYEKKEDRVNPSLISEDQRGRVNLAYDKIRMTGDTLLRLAKENKRLLRAGGVTPEWRQYVHYMDQLVATELEKIVHCNLDYLLKNTSSESANQVFIDVRLDIINADICCQPSTDIRVSDNLLIAAQTIMDKIFDLADALKKLSRKLVQQSHMEDLQENAELTGMADVFMNRVREGIAMLTEFCTSLEAHSNLWVSDKEEFKDEFLRFGRQVSAEELEQFGEDGIPEQPATLEQIRNQIDSYDQTYETIAALEATKFFNSCLRVDCRPFKATLLCIIKQWSRLFKDHLASDVTNSLQELADFVDTTEESLLCPVQEGDYERLVAVMGDLIGIKNRTEATNVMFEPLKQKIVMLRSYGVELADEVSTNLLTLPEKWSNILKLSVQVKQQISPLQANEVVAIRRNISTFDICQHEYRERFRKLDVFQYSCPYPYHIMDRVQMDIAAMECDLDAIISSATLFEVQVPHFKQLNLCRKEAKLIKNVWDYAFLVKSFFVGWKTTLWSDINVDNMDIECKRFASELRVMDKEVRAWDTYLQLETDVKNMIKSLRAVSELQTPAIRYRHWIQLMQATKVKFLMNDETTLADLLVLNLHNFEAEVHEIADKAAKEMSMEKSLNEISATWTGMEFERELHLRTNLNLLKTSEELIETLEDNQVQLQNMMNSKYVGFFLNEISTWQSKLNLADQIIVIWFEVQRAWINLENIFIGSEDIREQLPQDSRRFDGIDASFKQLVSDVGFTSNVIEIVSQFKLYERLEALQYDLTLCEKALADYLESKRMAFPRFYFVSSADLLDILSNGNRPEIVTKHLTKLFDSMANLKFEDSSNKRAVGMFAKDGEYVPFDSPVDCIGQVESWLHRVLERMRCSVRYYLTEAVATYEKKPREQWLFDYPAQIALTGSQIWWATEVNFNFSRLEGYKNALKDYNKKQVNQLNALITLLIGDLSRQDRQKIVTVCTIDVHSRDVVSKLVSAKVESEESFSWQSQLRHRWDDGVQDCFANICDAQFIYSHEYLGNTPRLVITPLTDRCYITLTQSLHLIMGGAPAGPAGTGKTETTKDLGKALGMMVYVFNCSEQMDYKSCGNIYKGLSQTGAWGCFDEFNRISVEVLSVVAVQVKSVHDAIRNKKSVFNFLGEDIVCAPSVGIFITMNPGYAGRTELPENLKALFRPCAMVVPDIELICEIMLVSEGFVESRLLARKFITLYTLCKELLSKQDHYDWGLRAVKSVLVVAGALKRGDKTRPEDQVLMRALRDFNIPKIVTNDVPVFMGLIGDLFPSLDVPRKRDISFENVVKESAVDLKLQPEDNFVLKVVQLDELLEVRHSVFIIGNTGTGKTQAWKTLYKTHQTLKHKPMFVDLNPKAVTNDDLFGTINPATREWKDGLLSCLMRDMTNATTEGPRWIVLDGDIDPMWIESLNTVMDDNKVLTLASNERIALTSTMRLIFEIGTLKHATPATVSRAGILYINSQDVGWTPYVNSWLDTRTVQFEKAFLDILLNKYVPACLEVLRTKFKTITPIAEISHIQMLCKLLDCMLTEENVPVDSPNELYEMYFCFCAVWAFGSAMFHDQMIDHRLEFSRWWTAEFKTIKFPSQGTVFDYCIDAKSGKFVSWSQQVEPFIFDPELPLQSVQVPTLETRRLEFFMNKLMEKRYPVMLVGPPGSGKTVLINNVLNNLEDGYLIARVPFNFYTNSQVLQQVLEHPLEKKAGRTYAPIGNNKLVYFIDDMNMPEVDLYDTVQCHTLLRQHMDYQHWYDRHKLTLKDIHNVQYVSAMNPTAGSFTINPRLQRHFAVFSTCFPGAESLNTIYTSIMDGFLTYPSNKFSPVVVKMGSDIVKAAFILHHKVTQQFLPTAIKFHYVFNLRDLSNIFQGILLCTPKTLATENDFMRVWIHESERVYGDKLVEGDDVRRVNALLNDVVKKSFGGIDEENVLKKPNIWCHFAEGIGEPIYNPVKHWSALNKVLQEALNSYNDLNAVMNLVLFEDAMMHICRINRILESPRGNALLVGVGGSGKQSLSRLAAFIAGLEVSQITLRKGYCITDLKSDLALLYHRAGLKNIGIMFLMTDAQIADEHFLVLINDLLASGEIPDLFADDEVEDIINAMRSEVKAAGMMDTRENCWQYFINKVRRTLRVVLCFSPVGNVLRLRARKFPAIINCTSIDWFHEWPEQALVSVSQRFLSDIKALPEDLSSKAGTFMASVHLAVNQISHTYLQHDRRYNYTTPKSFLEQIALYVKLLSYNLDNTQSKIMRLENGLEKLRSTGAQVDDLKEKLASQEVELKIKNDDADLLIEIIGRESKIVKEKKEFADEEEMKVNVINKEVSEKQRECESDLKKAEPALLAAMEALNTLNKNNLTEMKSFGSPPAEVVNVSAAVMVLLASNGRLPKDRSWKACKVMMSKVDQFLDKLKNYDKEHIHPACIEGIKPYLANPSFNFESVKTKSLAAAGLCAWVINIIKFYEVYCEVEPKRLALQKANSELEAAQSKLDAVKSKVKSLEDAMNNLKQQLETATEAKLKCQAEADSTAHVINLANRLVNGLSSENVRWAQSIELLQQQKLTTPGDILLVTAFLSYAGCFSKNYRTQLMEKHWLPSITQLGIPVTAELDPLDLLTDEAQIATWNNLGLPNDRVSVENATMLTKSDRWPLMIDPQLQGVKWIKSMHKDSLQVVRLGEKSYMDTIEKAISTGSIVLIENIGETIDPILDPLLARNLVNKGRMIKLGDKEIEYKSSFKLILHTKLANPHYKPEIQAQTSLINFTVTKDGLEDQLLAEVVKAERPDLEEQKLKLTTQQNEFKIQLKKLEDNLLSELSSAGGNFIGDTKLVESLEFTKKTAAEVTEKVAEAKSTSIKIDKARELYRPAAARASLLYFILNDLNKINPIYRFSLKAFSVVFHNSIRKADESDDIKTRVNNLIDSITYFVFMYTTRGLFEKDKLIFTAQMTLQILLATKEIKYEELDFLLRFPIMSDTTSPVDFLNDVCWGGIRAISNMTEFRGLDKDIEGSSKRWKTLCESECPENENFPQGWKNKTGIQRLCMMRALRPDRMIYAVRAFIEESMGFKYIEGRSMNFSKTFEESNSATPVFFILSPGVDPLKDVEKLGKHLGYTFERRNFHNVSLGQGQEVVAEQAMDLAAEHGHWVILQNIHLVKNWLPNLEKRLETTATKCNENYRVFMSAEPASNPDYHVIPQGILETAIKIANEAPTGMFANLHKALDNFNQDTLEMCSKKTEFTSIIFSLCYFHAVVAERRKFGAQGWNRSYPFNVGDLTISVNVLYNYLETNSKVPFEDLRYLFGEIMYGGHITDDWDRRLCKTYLEVYMHPGQLEGDMMLAPNFPTPPYSDYSGYHEYIDEHLPVESPYLYGLHPNAEIGFLSATSENLFRTLLELQSQQGGAAGDAGVTREEKIKQALDEVLEKLPEKFNMADIMSRAEERTPYVVVAFQECERMNILTSEIRRSLKELDSGLKGELSITNDMEDLSNALFFGNVPASWTKRAYPSLNSLTVWYTDLLLRIKELVAWIGDFQLPAAVWLSGFFNPQSFLTAIMQSTARKMEWPLDRMCLQFDVTKKSKEDFSAPPREGAYIHGLFMEGARWDTSSGSIVDAKLKDLYPQMPVIFIKAITQDRQETKTVYACPAYKTRDRGPTFIWTFNLKTKEPPSKWTLAGVALLLQI